MRGELDSVIGKVVKSVRLKNYGIHFFSRGIIEYVKPFLEDDFVLEEEIKKGIKNRLFVLYRGVLMMREEYENLKLKLKK